MGYLVCFEGINFSGKSTLLHEVKKRLDALGYRTILTKEPGGTQLGRQLRDIVLNNPDISDLSRFLLFLADRAEHIDKVIRPNLRHVDFILSDRSLYSTIVYQCYLKGIVSERHYEYLSSKIGLLYPTEPIVFVCVIDRETYHARARHVRGDLYDNAGWGTEYLAQEFYIGLAGRYGFHVIDGRESIENNVKRVVLALSKLNIMR
jgi:dTMP kinase